MSSSYIGAGIVLYDHSIHRWLVNQGRDNEALAVLSEMRGLSPDTDLVRLEFLYACSIPFFA